MKSLQHINWSFSGQHINFCSKPCSCSQHCFKSNYIEKSREPYVCVCVLERMRVCVLVRERERERERDGDSQLTSMWAALLSHIRSRIRYRSLSLTHTHALTHTHTQSPPLLAEGCTCERLEGQRSSDIGNGRWVIFPPKAEERVVDSDVPHISDNISLIFGHIFISISLINYLKRAVIFPS